MKSEEKVKAMRELVRQHNIDHDTAGVILGVLNWVLLDTEETPISYLPTEES